AMDWLAQLREEDGTEPSSDADGKPTADAAPTADAVPPVPVPRAAAEPKPAERLAAEPKPAAQQAAESLPAAPLAVEPKPAAPLVAEPKSTAPESAEPLDAEPLHAAPLAVEPLAPVTAEPHSVDPQSAEPQPGEPVAAEPPPAVSLAAEPPPAVSLVAEPVGAEAQSFEPLTAEPLAPLPPVPSAAEPLAPLPPVPVPRAADVPPVAAWASAAWATAATPAAAVPPASLPGRRTRLRTSVEITERSAIGDELRIPIAWCEMGSCISHHEDPAALGEADIRARAVAEGWRVDALGRLACPKCQQSDAWFWTAHPVAPWDRETAVARTTLMAAVVREHAAFTDATERERGVIPEARPAVGVSMARGRHREYPGRLPRGPAEESRESYYTV
ncbi:MAG: hypothetical protein ACTHPS_18665, partial [Streptosporangiaceae bacterium]